MNTITELYWDSFLKCVAVGRKDKHGNCIAVIDYHRTVEEALKMYPDAIVDPYLADTLSVNKDSDYIVISANNQELIISVEQARKLKEIL